MKKYLLIIFLCSCFSISQAQTDSSLNRIIIKTLPLKFLTLHPNVGVELPLSQTVHAEMFAGIYLFHIYMGDDIADWLLMDGTGYSGSIAMKFFVESGNSRGHFYIGPYMYFRYYKGVDEMESPEEHLLRTASFEIKAGMQNQARTMEPFIRGGMKYVNFDYKGKFVPVISAGFALMLPLN